MKLYQSTPQVTAAYKAIFDEVNATHYAGRLGAFPGVFLIKSRNTYGRCANRRTSVGGITTSRDIKHFELSVYWLAHLNSAAFRTHVLHEISHGAAWIVHGSGGHGPEWKYHARKLGIEGSRCSDHRTDDGQKVLPDKVARYEGRCPCGTVHEAYRMAGFVKNPDNYTCLPCGRKLHYATIVDLRAKRVIHQSPVATTTIAAAADSIKH